MTEWIAILVFFVAGAVVAGLLQLLLQNHRVQQLAGDVFAATFFTLVILAWFLACILVGRVLFEIGWLVFTGHGLRIS